MISLKETPIITPEYTPKYSSEYTPIISSENTHSKTQIEFPLKNHYKI